MAETGVLDRPKSADRLQTQSCAEICALLYLQIVNPARINEANSVFVESFAQFDKEQLESMFTEAMQRLLTLTEGDYEARREEILTGYFRVVEPLTVANDKVERAGE